MIKDKQILKILNEDREFKRLKKIVIEDFLGNLDDLLTLAFRHGRCNALEELVVNKSTKKQTLKFLKNRR